MLGTALGEITDKKQVNTKEGKVVVQLEGTILPDWQTDYEEVEAKNVFDKSAHRLMQRSAREDDLSSLRHLIKESRVNPNLRDKKGWTALLRAAKCNSNEVVMWLCRAKADVDTVNQTKNSPLMKAASKGHSDVVSTLVREKADVNLTNQGGASALMQAVQTSEENGAVKILLEAKADVNYKKGDVYYTALMLAARHGNTPAVSLLVHAMAHLENKDAQGETALAKALKYDNQETAGILKRAGAAPAKVTVVKKLSGSGKDSARMRGRSREKGARSSSASRSLSAPEKALQRARSAAKRAEAEAEIATRARSEAEAEASRTRAETA